MPLSKERKLTPILPDKSLSDYENPLSTRLLDLKRADMGLSKITHVSPCTVSGKCFCCLGCFIRDDIIPEELQGDIEIGWGGNYTEWWPKDLKDGS